MQIKKECDIIYSNIKTQLIKVGYMEKFIYYISPFIMIPSILLIGEYIDNLIAIPMFLYFIIMPIFLSCIMGIFSPTHYKYDYIITVMMPLSLFCFMLVGGFFDKSDLGTSFHLDIAFKTALQPTCLIVYCCMATSAFISSYNKFRIRCKKESKST